MTVAARIAILVFGVAVGVAVELSSGARTPLAATLEVTVGVVFLGVAAAAWSRSEVLLGAAASVTWFIGGLQPLAFAAYWHRGVLAQLIVHVAWRGRPPTAARVVVAISYALAVTYPAWTADAITVWVASAWAAAALTVVVAPHGRRRNLALSAAALTTAGTALAALIRLAGAPDAGSTSESFYELCLTVAGVLMIIAVRAPALDTLVDAVVRLGERGSEVRDQLAHLLGDPGLEIGYWDAARGIYRREDGGELTEGSDARRIDLDGDRAALLVHRGTAIDDALLDRAVLAAVGIRREHERLIGEARGRVAAVTDARRRIAVADASERERFGRELQHTVLEPLAALGAAMRDDRARELLTMATDDLRVLAAGLAPEALAGGLPSALRIVAGAAPVPVEVRVDDDLPEPDAATAACLYFVCAEGVANAVRYGSSGSVSVTLRGEDRYSLSIGNPAAADASQAAGSGLEGLRDRVEALGGSLRAGRDGEDFVLLAVLPLRARSADPGERAILEEGLDEVIRPGTGLA